MNWVALLIAVVAVMLFAALLFGVWLGYYFEEMILDDEERDE